MSKKNSYLKSKRRHKFETDDLHRKAKQMQRPVPPGKNRKKNILYRKLS